MTAPAASPGAERTGTAGAWFLLAALVLGALFGLHRIVDPDLFEQVAVGRAILADPSSLGVSTFHDQWPRYAFVADKWLASVIAAIFASLGANGLMIYQILLPSFVAGAWFIMFRAWGAGPEAGFAAVSVTLLATAFRLEPRPETISHGLLALLVALLATRIGAVWLLVSTAALMALWVNLHGYFLNGLLVLLAASVCCLLGMPPDAQRRGTTVRSVVLSLGLVAAGTMACLVHPQGWKALAWPFRQLLALGGNPIYAETIQELRPSTELLEGMGPLRWVLLALVPVIALLLDRGREGKSSGERLLVALVAGLPWLILPPPGLVQWPYRVTIVLLIAAVIEAPAAFRRRSLLPLILAAGSTVLAVRYIRNQGLIPPMAMLLLVAGFRKADSRAPAGVRARRAVALLAALLVLSLRLADFVPPGTWRTPGWTGWGVDRQAFPAGATEFVASSGAPGPILNDFQSGGYLLYRLHPQRHVFIAGNTSMYPPAHLQAYRGAIMGGGMDLDGLRDRYGFRTVVLAHAAMETAGLTGRLARSPDWSLVFLDEGGAVWERRPDAGVEDAGRPESGAKGSADRTFMDRVAEETDARLTTRPYAPWSGRRLMPSLNFGIFLRAAGRPDLARRLGERFWAEGPEQTLAGFLAAAAEESGRLPDEVPRLDLAFTRWPRSEMVRSWLARALFLRAISRMEEAELVEARADLERSAGLAPGEPGPLMALARLEASEGDMEAARRLVLRILENGPPQGIVEAIRKDELLAPLAAPGEGSGEVDRTPPD